jgi:hypothetical protein
VIDVAFIACVIVRLARTCQSKQAVVVCVCVCVCVLSHWVLAAIVEVPYLPSLKCALQLTSTFFWVPFLHPSNLAVEIGSHGTGIRNDLLVVSKSKDEYIETADGDTE